MEHNYALQLWTVHEECEKDFRGMLRKASELGYTAVEFTGYYGLTAEELKRELDQDGLEPVSSQMMIPDIAAHLDGIISYAKEIGLSNIASCVADVSTREALTDTIEQLRPLVRKTTEAGLNFLYHNHAPEFAPLGGELPIHTLLKAFEKENFYLELDTYWALDSGVDIISFMEQNASRIKNIHIKDGDGKGRSCPFGQGVLDIKGIVSCARRVGVPHILVEDDTPNPDGLTVAALNIQKLKEWNV